MKSIVPPFLKPGDTIAIAATARSVGMVQIEAAVNYLREKGLKVKIDPDLFRVEHQFAGDDKQRAHLFNKLLNDDEVKAICCARGGYGTARMADAVDYPALSRNPKWIAGFSDVTVLLNQVYRVCNMATLHSTMPVFMHLKEGNELLEVQEATDSLIDSLMGKFTSFKLPAPPEEIPEFGGEIIGGNLSVLYSIMGSDSECDWDGKILFLEDVDEYYYHIDRIFLALKRAGKLARLKALVCGSFTQMHDHTVPFGYSVEEIILHHCSEYRYPVVFGLDAGHHLHNLCVPFGIYAEYKDGILTFAHP